MSLRLLNLSCMKDELELSYVFWLAMGRWQCTSLTAPELLARCLSIIYGSQQSLGLPFHQSPSTCRTRIPVGCKYRILAEARLCLELWGGFISPLRACWSQQSCAEDMVQAELLLAPGSGCPPSSSSSSSTHSTTVLPALGCCCPSEGLSCETLGATA